MLISKKMLCRFGDQNEKHLAFKKFVLVNALPPNKIALTYFMLSLNNMITLTQPSAPISTHKKFVCKCTSVTQLLNCLPTSSSNACS